MELKSRSTITIRDLNTPFLVTDRKGRQKKKVKIKKI